MFQYSLSLLLTLCCTCLSVVYYDIFGLLGLTLFLCRISMVLLCISMFLFHIVTISMLLLGISVVLLGISMVLHLIYSATISMDQ